ncbi:MAG: sulfotransferase, partial [Candidatus Heimdallarchaeota archaeon]|nr:sulfotransferase [Candidatus Heimdallarchaeota archaeon]MCK4877181.1 sulfotransferase [Candidatus Heimdallarchaeota archaeon]
MSKAKVKQDQPKEFTFPVAMYYIARFFNKHPRLTLKLSDWESKRLRKKTKQVVIERPIYVLGLARAGTTVTVEMLGKHPDVAYHKYLHLVNPYIPHWIQKIANVLPIFKKPVERLHKDKLLVNRDSPEAVEESYWIRFFDSIKKEKTSDILDKNIVNPEFEKYYVEIIKKLLVNQKSSRYITKNNYIISRMEYIKKIFSDAKFILMTRHPINHIASLVKQDKVLKELEIDDERLLDWTKIMGHREFGTAKICINLDNLSTIEKIRKLWLDKNTHVEGWAIYWASIHQYILDLLHKNNELADSTMLLRYEDLTDESEAYINKILEHTEISAEKF